MRKILTLMFSLIAIAGFSQSIDKLKSETRKIYDANLNMDFETVAELTYPKVYESNGKPAFLTKLDLDYQNDEFRKRIQIIEPAFQYSELKTIGDKKFYIVTYKNPTRYFFEQKMDAATAQQKANALKESTLAYEVIVEPKRNSINVKKNSKLIAVSDELTNGEWRFFNFDDLVQRQIFNDLFGDGVKKALGL